MSDHKHLESRAVNLIAEYVQSRKQFTDKRAGKTPEEVAEFERAEARALKFTTEYARLMNKFTDERVGKTPGEIKALNVAAERKAAENRERLWVHWLKVSSWTVNQAVFLLFGKDPNKPFIGYERYSRVDKHTYETARDRLAALADTQLLPTSRNSAASKLRYIPGELVFLASQEGWGFAKSLAESAERRGISVSLTSGFSIPHQRAQLTYELACALKRIDPKVNTDDVILKYTAAQFRKDLERRYGSTHKELVYCSPKTLEAARLNRKNLPGIPRVKFIGGRPELIQCQPPRRRKTSDLNK